ncbi:MAG: bifunctional DNA-formamidopyrimidine glycosylase/DNA-(apurinic or apyrimidinic site) lyase [Syntrophaceae bacterium]|nr:bifunctional DNA-formamidopyrimidine glycosylase/DNA-(apurinic or apyrimidinic site) lyase [Syntrophaceae bacterium]
MPELPEVETLRRQLDRKIRRKRIRELVVYDAKLGAAPNLKGRMVCGVRREGKFLEIMLDDGSALRLHLRMTGRLFWRTAKNAEIPAHTRFRLVFAGHEILGVDPRRFATLTLVQPSRSGSSPADLLENPDPSAFHHAARRRRLAVKAFLLDQSVFPGMGNIYACEILHAAAVDPRRPASSVSQREWGIIGREAKRILDLAILCRGTSMSDWRDLHGHIGDFQYHLHVYGRKGIPCPRCGAGIERIALGGRGTWFCPGCQK